MSARTAAFVLPAFVCAAVVCCRPAAGLADPAVEVSEESIILEIQRLLTPDASIADEGEREKTLLENLKKIPALLETMDRKYPDGKYRVLAHRLGLEAAVVRHARKDRAVTPQAVSAAAKRLLGLAKNDEGARAEATYVLLQMRLAEIPATAPARTPGATTTASTSPAEAAMTDVAGQFVRLAGDFPKTPYAAPALLYAGLLYLELGHDAEAMAALDRLTRDYPKDPYSLKAIVALVQLHELGGRSAEALATKRRCVENFPDSPAALKYRADIALAETVGKPFFLRYKSAQGQNVDIRDYKGKTVLVYFLVSVADEKLGPESVKTLKALEALAEQRGCVLLAVAADAAEAAQAVADRLAAAGARAPLLLDPEGRVSEQYGVVMIPSVAVVGPEGKLRGILASPDILAETRKALTPTASAPTSAPAR